MNTFPRRKFSQTKFSPIRYIIISTELPHYLHEIVPTLQRSHCNPGSFKPIQFRNKLFQNSFFLSTISEWNKFDPDIKNVDSYSSFRKNLLSFIRPIRNRIYSIYDPFNIVDFSDLRACKFRYNFLDTMNPLSSCSLETESKKPFSLAVKIMSHL